MNSELSYLLEKKCIAIHNQFNRDNKYASIDEITRKNFEDKYHEFFRDMIKAKILNTVRFAVWNPSGSYNYVCMAYICQKLEDIFNPTIMIIGSYEDALAAQTSAGFEAYSINV